MKEAGFSAADIFPLCKDERREGAQGVFKEWTSGFTGTKYPNTFGTLYKDRNYWRPNGPDGNSYYRSNCRVLEW